MCARTDAAPQPNTPAIHHVAFDRTHRVPGPGSTRPFADARPFSFPFRDDDRCAVPAPSQHTQPPSVHSPGASPRTLGLLSTAPRRQLIDTLLFCHPSPTASASPSPSPLLIRPSPSARPRDKLKLGPTLACLCRCPAFPRVHCRLPAAHLRCAHTPASRTTFCYSRPRSPAFIPGSRFSPALSVRPVHTGAARFHGLGHGEPRAAPLSLGLGTVTTHRAAPPLGPRLQVHVSAAPRRQIDTRPPPPHPSGPTRMHSRLAQTSQPKPKTEVQNGRFRFTPLPPERTAHFGRRVLLSVRSCGLVRVMTLRQQRGHRLPDKLPAVNRQTPSAGLALPLYFCWARLPPYPTPTRVIAGPQCQPVQLCMRLAPRNVCS
ncbi:hypothetical protein AcV7_003275 [Taiwanofungus camphoratus]|nr:hypothetical protein AcV7_003275 [Antrodia cinnamomea]